MPKHVTEITEETLSLVAPGHVWRRTDNGKESTVLLVGNAHLPEKYRAKYPMQVTYVDAVGNITTVPLATFVASREFNIVDPLLETRLLTLFSDDDEVSDTAEAEEDSEQEEVVEEAVSVVEDSGPGLVASFISTSNAQSPKLAADTIIANIQQLEQDPDISSNELRTKMIVSLDDVVTISSLNDAFGSEEGPVYGMFTVQGIEVDWKRYLGAYSVVDSEGNISAQLVFTEPLEYTTMVEGASDHSDAVTNGTEAATEVEEAK